MPNPSALDPSAASAALQRLDARLKALPSDRLASPRGDVKLAAMAALGVADKLAAPDVRARFARLPKEEFDPAHLDDLRDAAWAAYHAKSQLDAALAAPSDAPLAPASIEAGQQLKERMIRVLRYYFDGDAAVTRQLNPMGRRKTNAELPADLAKLAALYRERKTTLEADKAHYRAGDADEADKLAAQAAQAAAERRAAIEGRGAELVARAWTLLLAVYEEVRAAGLYLFRSENAAELFPSLASLPSGRGRPKKGAAAAEAPPSDPPPARAAGDAQPPSEPPPPKANGTAIAAAEPVAS